MKKKGCDHNDAVHCYISLLYVQVVEYSWIHELMDKLRREAREYFVQKPCNMRPEAELWRCTNLHCIWCLSFTVSSDWASHSEENQRGNLKRKRKKQHRYLLANLKRNTEKQDTITLQGTSDEKVASPAIHTSNSQEITCYRPYS